MNGTRRMRFVGGRVVDAIGTAREERHSREQVTPGEKRVPGSAEGAVHPLQSWNAMSVRELRAKCLGQLSWTRGYLQESHRGRLLATVARRFPDGMCPTLRERLARDLEHSPFWDCLATWLRVDSLVGLVAAWPELVPALAEFLSLEPIVLHRSPYARAKASTGNSDGESNPGR